VICSGYPPFPKCDYLARKLLMPKKVVIAACVLPIGARNLRAKTCEIGHVTSSLIGSISLVCTASLWAKLGASHAICELSLAG
jgi:hypothetical protein